MTLDKKCKKHNFVNDGTWIDCPMCIKEALRIGEKLDDPFDYIQGEK